MEFKIKNTLVKIEFSFFILMSFAVLYGYEYSFNIVVFSFFHETGHLAALLALGIQPALISLNFFGISLKYQNCLSKYKELAVILSGPLVNFVFYLIFKDDINLVLTILNILPVFPLDGGRMMKIVFPKFYKVINTITLIAVFILSFCLLINYKIYSLLLIAIYLIVFNISILK